MKPRTVRKRRKRRSPEPLVKATKLLTSRYYEGMTFEEFDRRLARHVVVTRGWGSWRRGVGAWL